MNELQAPGRAKLAAVGLLIAEMPQIDVPLAHHFAQGVYARSGVIPKGAAFVGRVHLQSQVNIISSGDITILTETGLVRLVGPCVWASPAGAQRAAYAHEETFWTTVLGTEKTDPDEVYRTCTAANHEDARLALDELLKIVKE
jgi:hypothetical protein